MWTAKKLRRGEFWVAKDCCDGHLKRPLLRMIECHACAGDGWSYDTWHKGRFIERWADPRIIAGLRSAFTRYDEPDIWRALVEAMRLFRWVALATTQRLGRIYPTLADQSAQRMVDDLAADP